MHTQTAANFVHFSQTTPLRFQLEIRLEAHSCTIIICAASNEFLRGTPAVRPLLSRFLDVLQRTAVAVSRLGTGA